MDEEKIKIETFNIKTHGLLNYVPYEKFMLLEMIKMVNWYVEVIVCLISINKLKNINNLNSSRKIILNMEFIFMMRLFVKIYIWYYF